MPDELHLVRIPGFVRPLPTRRANRMGKGEGVLFYIWGARHRCPVWFDIKYPEQQPVSLPKSMVVLQRGTSHRPAPARHDRMYACRWIWKMVWKRALPFPYRFPDTHLLQISPCRPIHVQFPPRHATRHPNRNSGNRVDGTEGEGVKKYLVCNYFPNRIYKSQWEDCYLHSFPDR